jgi:hypothetical protein
VLFPEASMVEVSRIFCGVPHYIYVHLVSRDRKGNRRAANEKGPKRNPTAIPEVGILAEFWNIFGGIPVGFRKA